MTNPTDPHCLCIYADIGVGHQRVDENPECPVHVEQPPPPEEYPCRITVVCDDCGTEVTVYITATDAMAKHERLDAARAAANTLHGWSCLTGSGNQCPTCAADQPRQPRLIRNTSVYARHPWPDDCLVQGGERGVVFTKEGTYGTAYVEAFPGTFLRGEGATLAEAEDACWASYQKMAACHGGHGPYEARGYTNGGGYCTGCGTWFSKVLPPTDADGVPTLMDRLFGDQDPETALEVFDVMARIDQLSPKPEGPGDD